MDKFEKKYGFREDKKVKDFHRSRRMFCIHKNKLHTAKPNLPYSHATWFEKMGWISKDDDKLMSEIIRGIVDSFGDIYFYVGYDSEVNGKAESVFFSYLSQLAAKLKLKSSTKIFGGLIKQKPGKIWPPRREYGKLKDNL